MRAQKWRNWLGNQRCVARWAEPRGPEALAEAVVAAVARGPVRCVGKGTAWSGLVVTDGTLLSTGQLTRVLELRLDDPEPTVLVESGVTVRTLTDLLLRHGYALIGPTMFRDVTVGGALATGSHGVGFASGTMADAVTELTIVDARGELRRFDRSDPAALALAKVSLGLLGAIYSVRLRIEPAFSVWIDEYSWPFADVVAGLGDLARTYDFVQFFWYPQADTIVVRGMRRLAAPPTKIGWAEALRHRVLARGLHGVGLGVQPVVAALAPAAIPRMMQAAAWATSAHRSWRGHPHRELHYREATPPCWSLGFGVPVEQLPAAMHAAAEVARWRRQHRHDGPTFPFYARMVGPSDAPLAASYGRRTCFIESVLCRGTQDVAGYYGQLEPLLRALPGARPHWAKWMPSPDGALARLDGAAGLRALRDVLDPQHSFTNEFCERLLR